MKEAFGGIFTLQAIVVALLIIMCLMAFAVNYSKAFRIKNEIITIIERHEGLTGDAVTEINETLRGHQYFLSDLYTTACREDGYDVYNSASSEGGTGIKFCIKQEYANNLGEINNPDKRDYQGAYYSIVTYVNIDVPIVNNIIPFTANFFEISGETALIYSTNHKQYCSHVSDTSGKCK